MGLINGFLSVLGDIMAAIAADDNRFEVEVLGMLGVEELGAGAPIPCCPENQLSDNSAVNIG